MSELETLYKTPQSELTSRAENVGEMVLATPLSRLVAAIIDGFVSVLVFSMAIIMIMPMFEEPDSVNRLLSTGLIFLGAIGSFLAVHGYLLAKHGQTVGKWVAKVKMVDMQGKKLSLGRILFARYLPVAIVGLIPIVSLMTIVDVLLIFRDDRRCLHDLVAGSQVVKV